MSGYRAAPENARVDLDGQTYVRGWNSWYSAHALMPFSMGDALYWSRQDALDSAAAACEALMCNPDNSHEATEAFRDAAEAIRKLKEQP